MSKYMHVKCDGYFFLIKVTLIIIIEFYLRKFQLNILRLQTVAEFEQNFRVSNFKLLINKYKF